MNVLLIEDDPEDSYFIEELLSEENNCPFDLEFSDRLSSGLKRLDKGGVDLILLDLSLPDSHGLETLSKVQAHAPDVPVVILTGLNDKLPAIKAVQNGAQDYLLKGQVNGDMLVRTMRYAIERHQLMKELHARSLTDVLTGLYNRRGFFNLAEQQLKVANREKREMLVIFVDLDDLKSINDSFGHQAGDQMLIHTADILKKSFRDSDIIARIGGDEFVIITMEACDSSNFNKYTETFSARLQNHLKDYNTNKSDGCRLSLSIGMAYYNPEYPCSIDELLSRADKSMYKEKKASKAVGRGPKR